MILSSKLVFGEDGCFIQFEVDQEDSTGEAYIREVSMKVTAEMFAYANALGCLKDSGCLTDSSNYWIFVYELEESLAREVKKNCPEYRASHNNSFNIWDDLIDYYFEQIVEELQICISKVVNNDITEKVKGGVK